jgi:hypothetical protein
VSSNNCRPSPDFPRNTTWRLDHYLCASRSDTYQEASEDESFSHSYRKAFIRHIRHIPKVWVEALLVPYFCRYNPKGRQFTHPIRRHAKCEQRPDPDWMRPLVKIVNALLHCGPELGLTVSLFHRI